MSMTADVRPAPNLREFTEEERNELALRCYSLAAAGNKEEAAILKREYPLSAAMANALKRINGIEALIASGLNLSRAVKEYGHGWLER